MINKEENTYVVVLDKTVKEYLQNQKTQENKILPSEYGHYPITTETINSSSQIGIYDLNNKPPLQITILHFYPDDNIPHRLHYFLNTDTNTEHDKQIQLTNTHYDGTYIPLDQFYLRKLRYDMARFIHNNKSRGYEYLIKSKTSRIENYLIKLSEMIQLIEENNYTILYSEQ